ncbi:MAG: N-acetylmuramoyl-L-alanine amidase [Shimia sp.]
MGHTNHWTYGVAKVPAYWQGAEITPEIVVLHDTASRLEKFNARDYLARKNTGKVSVHYVIELEGDVSQLVPNNRRANHAGRSRYHGREWCNGFSIGIELVNPGRMRDVSADGDASIARTWYGEEFEWSAETEFYPRTTPEHGHGLWMLYPAAQIAALTELLEKLFANPAYPLKDIVPHWYVSPGRKNDTNPLFPLEEIRARILGRDDPRDVATEEGSSQPEGAVVQVSTHGAGLNLRRWPSFNPNVLTSIPNGTLLDVERVGRFDGRDWARVQYGGHEGWVVGTYLIKIALGAAA